jgi:hypothetical protein
VTIDLTYTTINYYYIKNYWHGWLVRLCGLRINPDFIMEQSKEGGREKCH